MSSGERSWVGPVLSVLALVAPVVTACGGGTPAAGAGPTVVAGSYPFAFVAGRVAGRHASVQNLTSAGAEPHDLELTPQQVAAVAEADVVVRLEGFQPAVDDAVEENEKGTLVGMPVPEHDGHTEEVGHDHGDATDPHVWLDPTALRPLARRIAAALGEHDPEHARAYRRNAAALARDLRALDADLRRGLDDCARRTFVTSHAAFGHLAERYELRMVPIAGLSPEQEPSPARLAQLRDVVQEAGITTVFTETLASPALARTLADEVGVRTAVLDPVEGLTDSTADEDYFSLMRANLAALQEANGCS